MLRAMSASDVPPRSHRPTPPRKSVVAREQQRSIAEPDGERDAAGRVTRRVQNLERGGSRTNGVAARELAVERDDLGRRHAEPTRLFVQRRVQRPVSGVQQTTGAGPFAERSVRTDVIDVRVRVHEVRRANAECVETRDDRVRVVASVDDDRFARGDVCHDRARARERADRQVLDRQLALVHPKSRYAPLK